MCPVCASSVPGGCRERARSVRGVCPECGRSVPGVCQEGEILYSFSKRRSRHCTSLPEVAGSPARPARRAPPPGGFVQYVESYALIRIIRVRSLSRPPRCN